MISEYSHLWAIGYDDVGRADEVRVIDGRKWLLIECKKHPFREVEGLMKPGTSALFVLDDEGDMDVILPQIRGLGGTVLKTNVDVGRAKLIQSTLAAASAGTPEPGKQ